MGSLLGSPPIIINETFVALEHVMQRFDAIENKILTKEHVENLDKKCKILLVVFAQGSGNSLRC